MMYLDEFHFPDENTEYRYLLDHLRSEMAYDTLYPFWQFPKMEWDSIVFDAVTIFYGSNGCGKSTALNVIAQKLGLMHESRFNSSAKFDEYVRLCRASSVHQIPAGSRIITSDDVFDSMLDARSFNAGVDERRDELFREYRGYKAAPLKLHSMDDYDQFKASAEANRTSATEYVRKRVAHNIETRSNGESALAYFQQKIRSDALYLLDEPENSLSAERQIQLAEFLVQSARFYGCQLVIATHSPFLLAMQGARIYDLDAVPVRTARWTELPNVRIYYDFFTRHADAFEERDTTKA